MVVTRVVCHERERDPEPEPSADKCIDAASHSSTNSRKRCTPPKKKSKAEPEVVLVDSKRKFVDDEKGKRIANEGPSSTAMSLVLPPPPPQTPSVLKKPKIEEELEVNPNSAITCFGTPIVEEKSISTKFEGESEAGLPKKQNERDDGESRSLGIISVAPIAAVKLDLGPHQNVCGQSFFSELSNEISAIADCFSSRARHLLHMHLAVRESPLW